MALDVSAAIAQMSTLQASGPIAQLIKTLPDATLRDGELLKFFAGKTKSWDEGGDYIYWNVKDNSRRADYYSNMQTLTRTPQSFLKPLSMIRANLTIDVTYARTDVKKNANSPLKMTDFLKTQIDLAKQNATQTLESDILGDGTTSVDGTDLSALDAHHIYGLQYWIENAPSGGTTIAGTARSATTTWLNNQFLDFSNIAGVNPTNVYKLRQRCTRNGKAPDVCFCSDTAFRALWSYAKGETWDRPSQKAVDLLVPEYLNLGGMLLIPLKAMTGTTNGGMRAAGDVTKLFMINTDEGTALYIDPTDNWVMEPVFRAQDKLAYTQDLCWSGQFVALNPSMNGVGFWT